MTRTRSRGFSLIELMVAMTVALFVIGVAASSYLASKRMYSADDQSARMQENARLGMELIEHDFRMAGYKGCVGSNGVANMYVSYLNNQTALLYNFVHGVQGYHGAGGAWLPALDPTLTALPQPPKLNTDVLVTRFPATAPIGLSAQMASQVGDLNVAIAGGGFLNPFSTGDILMVSDCNNAAVFQMSNAGPNATGIISHAIGGASPGNNGPALNKVYATDAQVVKMVTAVYYIAPSAILPGVNSLWCWRSDGAVGGVPTPQEMVLDVDDMKVLYGEDTSGGPRPTNASGYWTADQVNNFDNVVSLQVSLLVSSSQANGTQGLGPQTYYFNGANQTAADNRLYLPFVSVMTLRNRAP